MYHSNRISATVRKISIVVTNANGHLMVVVDTGIAAVRRREDLLGTELCLSAGWCSGQGALVLEMA